MVLIEKKNGWTRTIRREAISTVYLSVRLSVITDNSLTDWRRSEGSSNLGVVCLEEEGVGSKPDPALKMGPLLVPEGNEHTFRRSVSVCQ